MRFGEFLRVTVLLSAAAATLLAVQTLVQAAAGTDPLVIHISAGWWSAAIALGLWLGRGSAATPPIADLLAGARSQTMLPELRPAAVLLGRLWLLLSSTLLAVVIAFVLPQVASVGAGFAMIWSLAWRRQHRAVAAIEERDGVRFYVERSSPLQGIRLVRTPGFGGRFLEVDGARSDRPPA
ncbi:MAG: hypothetical protein AVDCRST_MAG38-271 [uncultured Solirubrobacteraceae bacterium]|uniref:Uncharacterized protein n=1 Tax=uncultured Solirubrobacteraceae bacterium TaxID=1162706 RepID=A0A6J4R7M1_9ACTN|nr:MAG: hypothetical protein AVDCRST_MAG38-271 [uncultured Solirubrobacteraceae bacterium]